MSKDRERKDLLKNMCSKRAGAVEKVICFRNNEVPAFLAKLDRFEAASKKSRLVVGSHLRCNTRG